MVHAAISHSPTKTTLTIHASIKTERRYGALQRQTSIRKENGVSAESCPHII